MYIVDVDLEDYKDRLYKSDKIIYLNSGEKEAYSGVHSWGWYNNTSQKTKFLYQLLSAEEINDPIILIDSDVLILSDISKLIDTNYDMQFTTMSEGSHVGASGIRIHQIGCFVVCKDKEKSKRFVKSWAKAAEQLKIMNRLKPHETPAMNILINMIEKKRVDGIEASVRKVIREEDDLSDLKIGYLDDKVSCSDRSLYDTTVTLHFKTNGGTQNGAFSGFRSRIGEIKCYSNKLRDLNLQEYINMNLLSEWIKNFNR